MREIEFASQLCIVSENLIVMKRLMSELDFDGRSYRFQNGSEVLLVLHLIPKMPSLMVIEYSKPADYMLTCLDEELVDLSVI